MRCGALQVRSLRKIRGNLYRRTPRRGLVPCACRRDSSFLFAYHAAKDTHTRCRHLRRAHVWTTSINSSGGVVQCHNIIWYWIHLSEREGAHRPKSLLEQYSCRQPMYSIICILYRPSYTDWLFPPEMFSGSYYCSNTGVWRGNGSVSWFSV